MMKAQQFTIATSYKEVLEEAERTAKYSDMSINSKLIEYRKLCKAFYNNKNIGELNKQLVTSKFFKAKELIDINRIRRN